MERFLQNNKEKKKKKEVRKKNNKKGFLWSQLVSMSSYKENKLMLVFT